MSIYYNLLNKIIGKLNSCVKFIAQTLTDDEKAVARSNIGAQATLAGTEGQVVGFDADGNAVAQAAPSGGGSVRWKDVTGRPVVVEGTPDTLDFDFGIFSAGLNEDNPPVMSTSGNFFKISDAAPTLADFANGATFDAGGVGGTLTYDEIADAVIQSNVVVIATTVYVIPSDNYTIEESWAGTFPEKGTYVSAQSPYFQKFTLTIPGYTGFGQEKIAPSHLYQPDWNQNDETAADFIKNRPFGTVDAIVLDEQTVTFTDGMANVNANIVPEFGTTIAVTFEGTVYNCEIKNFSSLPAAGNFSMIGGGEDTGEPFFVGFNGLTAILFASVASAVVRIDGVKVEKLNPMYYDAQSIFYCKLDDKYIYADASFSRKATKSELIAAVATKPILFVHSALGYCLPIYVNADKEYAYAISPFAFDSDSSQALFAEYYTAEYTPTT